LPSFCHQSWSILPTKFVCGVRMGCRLWRLLGSNMAQNFSMKMKSALKV
jgi:hypothetical protein